jgi:flagellum-specific peptidoglycan hydrolase FlgJ
MADSREAKVKWLQSLVPAAQRAAMKWPGMRVAVSLAQAALETGWGARPIGGWNLWGLKNLKWNPGKVLVKTKEWDKELNDFVETTAEFEDFETADEAFECYGRLVTNSPYYRAAREAVDLAGYVHELAKVWATDPQYEKKVWAVIKAAGLEAVDG